MRDRTTSAEHKRVYYNHIALDVTLIIRHSQKILNDFMEKKWQWKPFSKNHEVVLGESLKISLCQLYRNTK